MNCLFLPIQISFEMFSSRLYHLVPNVEASLKITQSNWRQPRFCRSVLILIRALNWFGRHRPSQCMLYSSTALVHGSITWDWTRTQGCTQISLCVWMHPHTFIIRSCERTSAIHFKGLWRFSGFQYTLSSLAITISHKTSSSACSIAKLHSPTARFLL